MNDISEIVERLRVFIGGDLGTKAADKIETLLDERDMMQDAVISRDMTIDALRAELATLKQAQDPVAWFEAEESARGANPREIMWGMAHSTRMSKEKPNTTNPVWALYAAPKPGKPVTWERNIYTPLTTAAEASGSVIKGDE